MDFIRKNWSRLSLALLFLIAGVFAIVAWVTDSVYLFEYVESGAFFKVAILISTIAFFFGMVAVCLAKSFPNSKKAVSIIYMVMGAVSTIILLVYVCVAANQEPDMVTISGVYSSVIFYMLWVPLFVFGLHPLIKGVTRFVETTTVPAKATVAQPTAEVAAEAPKAPAKKAPAKKAAAK